MDIYEKAGQLAIGSRLRLLSERVTQEAIQLYQAYNVDIKPKWWPILYLLRDRDALPITSIAREIRQSHPSVSKLTREMVKHGLLIESSDPSDGRKNLIRLSAKGEDANQKVASQEDDVIAVMNDIFKASNHNLWSAIEEFEYHLDRLSLYERTMLKRKERAAKDIEIVDYLPKYAKDFKDLNQAWIEQYFKMEEADHNALDNPDSYIIDKGGHIFIALYKGRVVGVCGLIKLVNHAYDYELAKMAVDPSVRGRSIGYQLGVACIEKAKSLGGKNIFLESNTLLKPAISLYHKLGFKKLSGFESPYERCNIQMAIDF